MCRIITSIDSETWRDFVYNHPHGNIFQTPEMAEIYMQTKRREPIFIAALSNDGEIIALMQAMAISEIDGSLGCFSGRSIIQGGPLFIESDKSSTALKSLMENYDKIAHKKGLYTQIRNLHDNINISHIFKGLGYKYENHLNYFVDLTKSREELWENLSKKRRNGIRKAEKNGVIIEEIENRNLISSFYELIQETYRNAKLPLADITFFKSAFEILGPNKMVKFFLAKYKDKYIGAIGILIYKKIIYDWYAGASLEHLHLCPNDILTWHAIEWGHEKGYQTFDFGGAGKTDKEYGVRDFKKQFGGNLVNLGRYTKVYSPIRMKIAEMGFQVYRNLLLK